MVHKFFGLIRWIYSDHLDLYWAITKRSFHYPWVREQQIVRSKIGRAAKGEGAKLKMHPKIGGGAKNLDMPRREAII